MAHILNKESSAIGLTKEALEILKKEGKILNFKLKESKDKNLDIEDLHFKVTFKNKRSAFELRLTEHKLEKPEISNKNSRIRLYFGNKIPEIETIINLLSEKIPGIPNYSYNKEGFIEEKRYSREVLEKMKDEKIIEDWRHASKEENINEGIDFFIIYAGKEIPIQVKSSTWYQQQHTQLYPKIPSILVKNIKISKLRYLTLLIIKDYLNNKVIHV